MTVNIPPTSPQPLSEDDDLTFANTPNFLTLSRIGFVPVVVVMLLLKSPLGDLLAAGFFILASLTDWMDGYIARRDQLITVYGKLMDPLADKFLVISSLVMLQYLDRIHPVVVILLICRELTITGLRALASAEGVIIAASPGAKWKTATQMVAIPFIMIGSAVTFIKLGDGLAFGSMEVGIGLLYFSLALSLWSAKDYVVAFFKGLKEARKFRTHERRLARAARKRSRADRFTARIERK